MRLRTILAIIGVPLLLLMIAYFVWAMVLLGSVGGPLSMTVRWKLSVLGLASEEFPEGYEDGC